MEQQQGPGVGDLLCQLSLLQDVCKLLVDILCSSDLLQYLSRLCQTSHTMYTNLSLPHVWCTCLPINLPFTVGGIMPAQAILFFTSRRQDTGAMKVCSGPFQGSRALQGCWGCHPGRCLPAAAWWQAQQPSPETGASPKDTASLSLCLQPGAHTRTSVRKVWEMLESVDQKLR